MILWRRGAPLLVLAGCILSEPAPLARYEFTEAHMGTIIRIVLYAETEERAREASRAAYREIVAVDDRMSDYKEGSELSLLSRLSGQGPQHVTDPMWEILEASGRFAEMTGGAFDVTVGPAVRLWRRARRERSLPERAEIGSALEKVGPSLLVLDPAKRTADLRKEGMILDLGGVAKGYACDRALAALASMGIRHAMVDAGGGMALGDPPPGRPAWRIQVGPEGAGILLLSRCGVATSGDTEQSVELEGRRYSHIVDPKTGLGLIDSPLVTVLAPDGMSADALSTALSVMGRERGLRLAEDLPGTEALFRWREGGRWRSAQTRYFATHLQP